MHRSRGRHQLRVAFVVFVVGVVVGAGCTSYSESERAEIAEAGEVQLARHAENELVLPLPLDTLTLSAERSQQATAVDGDPGPFTRWSDQIAPNWYEYSYGIAESATLAEVFDEAVAFLEERGAVVVDERQRQVTLEASSLGDEIVIELRSGTGADDRLTHWVVFGPPL